MVKRRRTVIEELQEVEETLVSGGEDFQICLDLFLKDMSMRNLAYHAKRWYKENLTIVKRALENKKYSSAPLHCTEKMLKDVIIYCMEQLGNNPTTINHRIRSMKQFYSFLHNESIIPIDPTHSLQKQKGKKEQIKPFTDDEVKTY
jgi:site-specific recombinase XerD